MLKKIIFHETLLNLTSFRFHLVVGLFVIMFFGGLFVSIDGYKAKLGEYNEIAAAGNPFQIAIPPNPLGVFADGMDQYSSMAVNLGGIRSGNVGVKTLGKDSVSLRFSAFKALDFNFAIKVLLSLGAILITFASVSGERFSGTLKLASASGVSKKNLILAKVSASFICLAIPLILCAIISCTILAINGMLTTSMELVRIGLFVIFSLIYVLFFLLVGLIISISTRRPQESLVTGVLFWLLFVFILPALTPRVSNMFADLPSARAMEEIRSLRFVGAEFEVINGIRSRDGWYEQYAENDADWEAARNQLANYAKVKRRIDMLSPADAYNNASMDIVGNGVENAFHVKKAVLQHKDNITKGSSQFVFQKLEFASDLVPALISIFVLCLEISVLLVFAYRKFMSLDLREG